MSIESICKQHGIAYGTVRQRIGNGMTLEQALKAKPMSAAQSAMKASSPWRRVKAK